MAKQTANKVYLPCTGGNRLVMQVGNAQFISKTKKVSLTIPFQQVDFGIANGRQASPAGTAASYMLYLSATMYNTKLQNYRVIISRRTGVVSALPFNYQLIGH